MTSEQMLAALEKAKADLAAAESLIAEQRTENDRLTGIVQNHETAIAGLTAERDAFKAQADTIPTLNERIAALEAEDRDLETAVAKRVAALGISAAAAAPDPTKKSGQQLAEEFAAITDPVARAQFFRDHASELKALAFKRN